MNYEEFFQEVAAKKIELAFDNSQTFSVHKLSNEALFHLPLLAATILLLSKDRRKPKIGELGQVVGECFERTFVGFKGSSQHLGWSANLRVRTVRALTFLEAASLVIVDGKHDRVYISEVGKKVIAKALQDDNDLSYTLKVIERNYRDLSVEKQISMELK